jgi:hypothetical protein
VEEKTGGRIPAASGRALRPRDVRGDIGAGGLRGLSGNVCCAVDAEQQSDLDNFCRQVLAPAPTASASCSAAPRAC